MKYFLGIDVGASKTHALIADETGRCLGFGKAGGGNHQSVGYDGLKASLVKAFEQARAAAGVKASQIGGAGFGVAGCDFPSDREPHLQTIAALGLSCPVEVVNDGVNGLLAGATRGIGVNVTAGSSNNCRGRGKRGQEGRVVGNGSQFGEFGGASEITARGLQMVCHAWTRRIPPTVLTKIYLEATGAKNEMDMLEGISKEYYHLYSFLAMQVIEAARAGDHAAGAVMTWAGTELGWLAVAVARQIEMEQDEVEIVQSGSIFEAGELITDPMRALVLEHCPKAKLIRLDGPPVIGAVVLGMEQGKTDGYAVRDRITTTAKELVN